MQKKRAKRARPKAVRRRAKSSRTGSVQSAGERTFSALIKSGSALLARKGLADISLRMIAKYAGYSPAVVYKHFHDKYALFEAIREAEFIPYMEGLEALSEQYSDPAVRIFEIAKSALSFSQNRGVVFGFDFLSASSQSSSRKETGKKAAKGYERSPSAGRIEKIVTAAVEEFFKTLPRYPVEPIHAAHQIFAAVLGVTALPNSTLNGVLLDKTETLIPMITAIQEHWKTIANT